VPVSAAAQNVCLWPKADIAVAQTDVRFQGAKQTLQFQRGISAFDPIRTSSRLKNSNSLCCNGNNPSAGRMVRFFMFSGDVMKKLATAIAAIALIGTPAFAADIAVKAPPAPAPAPISWTGWYAGFNFGGTWGGSGTTVSSVKTFDCNTAGTCMNAFSSFIGAAAAQGANGSLNTAGDGAIFGGQVGYNWQAAQQWVAGIEADFQGVGNKKTVTGGGTLVALIPPASFPTGNTVTTAITASRSVDYLGTVRARLGWLWTPSLLAYGTGGLAYGGVSADTSIAGSFSGFNISSCCGALTFGSSGGFRETRTGWTAGGGLEWMMAPNWSAKAEYLYYDLGSVTYSAGSASGVAAGGILSGVTVFTIASQASTRFNGNIVRVGLNYHF
jgi:outer membrane immunogenic protein